MSSGHCDTLILSPHLDDAVLSCSLRILKELSAGRNVKVATLFSGAWPNLFGVDFYVGRRAEDKAALAELGINNPIWLGFSDAIFRSPKYWGFSRIVLGEDSSIIDKVAAKVCQLHDECTPDTVLLPLAVGTHVDHRCTFAIWNRLPSIANVVFYEDRPYSFLLKSVPLRLKAIGAGTDKLRDSLAEELVQGLSSVTMYKNVLKNDYEKMRYADYLAEIGADTPIQASERQLINVKPEIIATQSEAELEQIVKANSKYVSQIGMLYDNMKVFRSEGASYARTLDPSALYAERYWRLMR